MGRKGTDWVKEQEVIRLYQQNKTIKAIMSEVGIKSEQTIYRILDANGIKRRPKIKSAGKVTLTFEADTLEVLRAQKSPSLFVNEAIRAYVKKSKKK